MQYDCLMPLLGAPGIFWQSLLDPCCGYMQKALRCLSYWSILGSEVGRGRYALLEPSIGYNIYYWMSLLNKQISIKVTNWAWTGVTDYSDSLADYQPPSFHLYCKAKTLNLFCGFFNMTDWLDTFSLPCLFVSLGVLAHEWEKRCMLCYLTDLGFACSSVNPFVFQAIFLMLFIYDCWCFPSIFLP